VNDGPAHRDGVVSIEKLRSDIKAGIIDTVTVAIVDMQGRLTGKEIQAEFFLEEIVEHGTEGCNYLLAVDVDMNTVPGYSMSSWETGYGDFVMKPDLKTLRYLPWQPKTAFVLADVVWLDGEDVVVSPRQILKRQLQRLRDRGLVAMCGTELEFIVFNDTYEEAWKKGYRNLEPANLYNVDYSIMGVNRVGPLLREIRLAMTKAGLYVESVKGECNLGQHEIAFRYAEALATCDNHVLYKLGAKEIAASFGKALTFMAKVNQREGSSCHTHLSIRTTDQKMIMADADNPSELSLFGRQFLAGLLSHLEELTLFFAPNINSYKRFVEGSFAPTAIAWGRDNRTCSMRVIGHGASLRVENRVPGGDANPYLAIAAMLAAGMDGLDKEMKLEDPFAGNAYVADIRRVPATMDEALRLWQGSTFVAEAFGGEVKEHYANMARTEITAYSRAVTDWELYRSFERM
jgi:glutamine synthetase